MKRRILAIGLLFLITVAIQAALPGTAGRGHAPFRAKTEIEKPLYFSHITKENGLPSNHVNCFIRDFEGYVWIGTRNGLARYDGHDITVYRSSPGDTASLADNTIYALFQTKDSMLWVGTSGGVSMLNPSTGKIRNYPELLKVRDPVQLNTIRCFFEDADGILWAGSNAGLIRIPSGSLNPKVIRLNDSPDMSSREFYFNQIFCITGYPNNPGKLLLGTVGGLIGLDTRTNHVFRDYKKNIGKFPHIPNDMFVDSSGCLWTCGWNIGLNRLDLKTGNCTEFHYQGKTPMTILKMLPGNNGNIWLATLDNGLGFFSGTDHSFRFFLHDPAEPNSLGSNEVEMVAYMNHDSSLWVATQGGISIINRLYHSFNFVKVPFKFDWINAFYRDKCHGKFYVGAYSAAGMFEYDEKTRAWELIRDRSGTDTVPFCVNNIFCDREGMIWISTRDNLKFLDRENICVQEFRDAGGKPLKAKDPVMYGITEDRSGNLWVGSRYCGVFCIDKSRCHVKNFIHEPGNPLSLLEGTHYLAIKQGKFGRIWLGCRNGISIYDPETGKFMNSLMDTLRKYGINKTWINGIESDSLGRMWLGIDGTGLLRVEEFSKDHFRFKLYHPGNGLNEQGVGWITKDSDGNLWVVNGGLLFVNPYREILYLVDEQNGLHEHVSWVPLIYADSSRNIYCASGRGFETKNIHDIDVSPPLSFRFVLESAEINGKASIERFVRTNSSWLSLESSENNLLFRYTAVCYSAAMQIHYKYRLTGYDRDWILADKAREARYTNLPPGKYELSINAEVDGKWFEPCLVARFVIKPVFWKTWWFLLLCVLSIVILTTLVTRYRERQLLKIERMRNRIATDLHDDVSSTLSSISILSEILFSRAENSESAGLLGEIGNNARGMLERIDDIIWSVRPRSDKIGDLGLRIREYAIPLFESRKINFTIVIPDSVKELRLHMEIRWNVYLIAKEAINNLIKYSACTHAGIILSFERKHLIMEIDDNGKGFDQEEPKDRNGIMNMNERALRINGYLKITSSPGNGTNVRLEAPC